ncbi:MAG TPA: hypothetical protein VK907_14020 [Phnomibacter sp.]|nr:hypothetical protein [Phnomibacter sp.]
MILQHFSVEKILSNFHKRFETIDTGFLIHNLLDLEYADQQMDPDVVIPRSWENVRSSVIKKITGYVNRQIQ